MFYDLLVIWDWMNQFNNEEGNINIEEETVNNSNNQMQQAQNIEEFKESLESTIKVEKSWDSNNNYFNKSFTDYAPYAYCLFIGLFVLFFIIDYIQYRKKWEENALRNAILESLIALIIVTLFWLIIVSVLMYL